MGPIRRSAAAAVVAGIIVAPPPAGPALTRDTGIELISVSYDGTSGDDGTSSSAISADGRYVAFISTANDLVAEPYIGLVHLRDRPAGFAVLPGCCGPTATWANLNGSAGRQAS